MPNPNIVQDKHNVNPAPKAGGSPSAPGEAQATPLSVNSTVKTERADLTQSVSPSAASDTALSALLSTPEPPAVLLSEDTKKAAYLYALGHTRDGDRHLVAGTRHYRRAGLLLATVDGVVQAILDGSRTGEEGLPGRPGSSEPGHRCRPGDL